MFSRLFQCLTSSLMISGTGTILDWIISELQRMVCRLNIHLYIIARIIPTLTGFSCTDMIYLSLLSERKYVQTNQICHKKICVLSTYTTVIKCDKGNVVYTQLLIKVVCVIQQGDDPPFLPVGTDVSAKYKGAFCEAKVRKVVRNIKCKVRLQLHIYDFYN